MKQTIINCWKYIQRILKAGTTYKYMCARCFKKSNEQEGLFCPRCNEALDRVMGKIN